MAAGTVIPKEQQSAYQLGAGMLGAFATPRAGRRISRRAPSA